MRKLFSWLPKTRGKRLLAIAGLTFALGLFALVTLAVTAFFLLQSPHFQSWLWPRVLFHQATSDLPEPPARAEGPPYRGPAPEAAAVRMAADVFRVTNIWTAHLRFSAAQWEALGPRRVPSVPDWRRPDGTIVLRNPAAARAGVAGVFGFDMPWSDAELEFGGAAYPKVRARFKGNGTFLAAVGSHKRSFKVDLDKHVPGRALGGVTTLNFGNLGADSTSLSDALAYEFFREAGVPAPRTAFARLFLTREGKFERRLLGLYVMVENPDAVWAREVFQTEGFALFKPVLPDLFEDRGGDWKAYERDYDAKTKVTPAQQRRLIELARLVSHASEAEFAARLGQYLELDAAARFFAALIALASYDSILDNNQNFLVYLDPRTDRFGFVPWDLDHSWGEFPMAGHAEERERASIAHPWVGRKPFLERLFAVEEFQRRYRGELNRLLETLFVPERLGRRVDELAAVIRPALAEESSERLGRFEVAVADDWEHRPRGGDGFGPGSPPFQLKRFIAARARSLREQLDGSGGGVVLSRRMPH